LRIFCDFDYRKPVLYAPPIQNVLGKLPVVPMGDSGTIPHHMRTTFFQAHPGPGPAGDCRLGARDGCRMLIVNQNL
jgi:hypothetical protein